MGAGRSTWMRGAALALALAAGGGPARSQPAAPAPSRVALVVGEGAYGVGPLPAAPDDAGLVAQVLAGAGFDVTAARDLDGDGLRRAFRDFLDRAGAAGPDGIVVVYFAGRAVQSDGDDYLVPVDARLLRPADAPIEALRLLDLTHALAALPVQARVVVVDGAYAGGPGQGAPGLALVEAEQGSLVAFNAAPGTAAPSTAGPYGAYAQALVGAVKQGGVPVGEVFDRVRLAVSQSTGGAEVPWDSDRLTRSFAFFDRAAGAPAMASAGVPFASLERRPLRDFPPDQAFDVALARDTVPAYAEFLAAFPDDPLARRVRLILAVRREALFWRAAVGGNAPGAYWTYLLRYPKGPHAADARRRLSRLSAAAAPPPRFAPLPFDVPPPGPDEAPYDGPIVFVAPDLPPPPPPPAFLLPPIIGAPPPRPAPPVVPLLLPIPVPVPVPYVRPPAEPGSIAPPRGAAGAYPRPRPYVRGPNGDGLVVQSAPASEPMQAPPAARPAPQPAVPPAQPRPPAGAGAPALASAAPPAVAPPTPQPVAPPIPRRPPVSRPAAPPPAVPSSPAVPLAPAAPPPSASPAGSPVPRPSAAPAPAAAVAPAHPPVRAQPVPPPAAAAPLVQRPAGHPAPHAPSPAPEAAQPHLPPVPSPPAVRPAPAPPVPPAPQVSPAPRPERAAPAQEPKAAPGPGDTRPPPHPAAPDRPAADRPAPDRAGVGHPPGQHREDCGRPGEPPCRP